MKPAALLCLLLMVVLYLANGRGQTSNEPEKTAPRPPCAEAILIISGTRHWSVDELNQVALKALRADNSMPANLNTQVIAHVLPGDPTNMCEFLYVQGFEQPYWRVKIGYDGKVNSTSKRIKKEG